MNESVKRAGTKARLIQKTIISQLPSDLTVVFRDLEFKFLEEPILIRNKSNEVIGVDAHINVFQNNQELKVDPHRICINPPLQIAIPLEQTTSEDVIVYKEEDVPIYGLREDPWAAYFEWLYRDIKENPAPKGFRTKGTVTTIFDGGSQGNEYLQSISTDYATARAGTSASPAGGGVVRVGQLRLGASRFCFESFHEFDCSSLPDTDIISAVSLQLYGTTDNSTTDFTAEVREYDWGAGALDGSDWVAGASLGSLTPLLATWDSSTFVGSAYNSFTENSTEFQDAIDPTDTIRIIIASDNLRIGNDPTTAEDCFFSSFAASGTSQDPKIVITHNAPPDVYDEEGSGGAVAGGVASITFFDYVDGLGGTVAGGVASITFFDYVDGLGGTVASGLGDLSMFEEGSGGAVAGGAAEFGSTLFEEGSGGVLVSGDATFGTVFDEEGSGGAVAGGVAFNEIIFIFNISGGAEIGGVADEIFVDYVEGDGGVEVDGIAEDNVVFVEEGDGGAITNGESPISLIYPLIEGDGGAELSGVKGIVGIEPFHEGGAEVGGVADAIFVDYVEGDGGVEVGGIADTTFFDFVDGVGGIVAGSNARVERIKFFKTVNTNRALAMGGDNIVKDAFFASLQGEQIVARFPPEIEEAPEVVEGVRFDILPVWCDFDDGDPCPENGAFLPDIIQSNQREENLPPKDRGVAARDRTIARLT